MFMRNSRSSEDAPGGEAWSPCKARWCARGTATTARSERVVAAGFRLEQDRFDRCAALVAVRRLPARRGAHAQAQQARPDGREHRDEAFGWLGVFRIAERELLLRAGTAV